MKFFLFPLLLRGNKYKAPFIEYRYSYNIISFMAKIDKQKESIGYLKVIFSILVAIDVSLVAWIFKNSVLLEDKQLIVPSIIVLLITIALIYVNKVILQKIDKLEEM